MRRRTLLASFGGLAAGTGLAGCLNAPVPGTPTEPPDGGQPLPPTDTSFEVVSRSCGTGRNDATIGFADGDVTVEGVIGGSDTCDTAQAAVRMDSRTLVLTVVVVEEAHTATVACAQCLTDIEYDFMAIFPNEGPAAVRVVHRTADGETTVATIDRA